MASWRKFWLDLSLYHWLGLIWGDGRKGTGKAGEQHDQSHGMFRSGMSLFLQRIRLCRDSPWGASPVMVMVLQRSRRIRVLKFHTCVHYWLFPYENQLGWKLFCDIFNRQPFPSLSHRSTKGRHCSICNCWPASYVFLQLALFYHLEKKNTF